MPVGNLPTDVRRHDASEPRTGSAWNFAIGRIGRTQLRIAYSVPIALLLTSSLVVFAASRPGNADLPQSAVMGAGIWVAGWLAQLIAWCASARLTRLTIPEIHIGLLGIEAGTYRWPPAKSLLVCIVSMLSVALLGTALWWLDGGFQTPMMQRAEHQWIPPSFGLAATDSILRGGAWLCWLQVAFQVYPLPRSLGRRGLVSMVGLLAQWTRISTLGNLTRQVMVARRLIVVIALATALSSLVVITSPSENFSNKWPIPALLGLLLWSSRRGIDLTDMLGNMNHRLSHISTDPRETDSPFYEQTMASPMPAERGSGGVQPWARVLRPWHLACEQVQRFRMHRNLRRAIKRERGEADEVARLDALLDRVHREGIDTLDAQERKLLQRVSENLRRQRDSEGQGS